MTCNTLDRRDSNPGLVPEIHEHSSVDINIDGLHGLGTRFVIGCGCAVTVIQRHTCISLACVCGQWERLSTAIMWRDGDGRSL